MKYSNIQPPFSLKFREMTREELNEYGAWFLKITPERIVQLKSEVRASSNFRTWRSDNSQNSLKALGRWLVTQVETRERSKSEMEKIKTQASFDFAASQFELTNRTFSLAFDVGIYFGESLIRRHSTLKWSQDLTNQKLADFGQMLVIGFDRVPLNPVRIAINFCYGINNRRHTGDRLGELYEYWSRLASNNKNRSDI